MCGIAGALFDKETISFPIRVMTEAIKHRGPDDEGYLLSDPAAGRFENRAGRDTHQDFHFPSIDSPWPSQTRLVLGHRRLSILDLSPAGHQPMSDSQKECWITYNGEIFNYRELRNELETRGVKFRTKTDTEVVIESYKIWGEDCLHRFNGMWAFALWDAKRKILFCARDRFGIKPFYYARQGRDFFFASEIKALLSVPEMSKNISEEAMFDYLALGLTQRGSLTFFQGIQSLEPGHALTVDLKGDALFRQWYLFPQNAGMEPYSEKSIQHFKERLKRSVYLRMQSDVPVGTSLSGGLDSSSIVCLGASLTNSPPQTFSACFEERRYDEREFILPVTHETRAVSRFIFPQGEDFWEKEWRDLIWHQEEPFCSLSVYAQWCVMREAARHHVPVLLNGQGGDELLGGYRRHLANRALGLIFKGRFRESSFAFKDARIFFALAFNLLPSRARLGVSRLMARFNPLLRPDFIEKHARRKAAYIMDWGSAQRSLGESLQRDLLMDILPSLLRYEDKNAMRFSVEVRHPFLDHELVEWVFRLEDQAKIEKGMTKRILRESMKEILPEKVRLRTDKMGFEAPQEMWLSMGRPMLLDFFKQPSKARVARWVNAAEVKKLIEKGNAWNSLLWRIINLEMWLRVFEEKFFEAAMEKPRTCVAL